MKMFFAATVTAVLTLATLCAPALAQTLAAGEIDYAVQAGDWLSKIALSHYGDAYLYPAIVLATNAQAADDSSFATITDPWRIEIGWKLRLPSLESAQAGITVTALRNAEYQSEWTATKKANLSDGTYTEDIVPGSATKIHITLMDRIAFGHTEDGEPFAAVLLTTDPGGSGTFVDLAVVREQDQKWVNTAGALVGDRVQIRSLSVVDGKVVLEMVTHGPNDPMCCPTQLVRTIFVLKDNALTEETSETIGVVQPTAN